MVHLASPFVLGVRGMAAAARLGIPAVAVYQTDLAGYARTCMGAGEAHLHGRRGSRRLAAHPLRPRRRRPHLASSRAALHDLETHGVPRVEQWPRGVDTARGPTPSPEPELPVPTTSAACGGRPRQAPAGVARRRTDLPPQLLTLAADELRHRARGTSARLDLKASAAVSAALAGLSVAEPADAAQGTVVRIRSRTRG